MSAAAAAPTIDDRPARLAQRRRRGFIVRRMPDEDGVLVTYLQPKELMALIQVSSSTVQRWMKAGAVRSTNRLAGTRYVSVADAARLKRLTIAESLALGIRRIPADQIRMQQDWFVRENYETLKTAQNRNEVWDDYDTQHLIDAFEAGRPLDEVAKALGRTYGGVCSRLDVLRQHGDLPPARSNGVDWWERTRELLTPDEAAALA